VPTDTDIINWIDSAHAECVLIVSSISVWICVSCQFVVRHGYDYAVHAIDPDTLVEWDHIEQVVSVCTSVSMKLLRY